LQNQLMTSLPVKIWIKTIFYTSMDKRGDHLIDYVRYVYVFNCYWSDICMCLIVTGQIFVCV
jgi:hypothetical protein